MRLFRLSCALMLALLLVCARAAAAQETTGTLTGIVKDIQGLPLKNVAITVIGPQGSKTATTNSQGHFSVPLLTPGTYTVRAEREGFKTIEQPNAVVSLGQTVNVAIILPIGAKTETITVTSETPRIDPTTSTTGAVVSSTFAASIPVGRRVSDVFIWLPESAPPAPPVRPTHRWPAAAGWTTSTSSTA